MIERKIFTVIKLGMSRRGFVTCACLTCYNSQKHHQKKKKKRGGGWDPTQKWQMTKLGWDNAEKKHA